MDLDLGLSPARCRALMTAPPIKSGRSKDVYRLDEHRCLVRLKPNLRSYTYSRDENIWGTETLRLDFFDLAANVLLKRGICCSYLGRISGDSYVAEYCEDPPFETIVKNRAAGSTCRLYPGLFKEGMTFVPPVVKFDFRVDPEDLPIGEDYVRAAGYPVESLKEIAWQTNEALCSWLAPRVLWDFCIVIGRDHLGRSTIISEISPDCMRLRSLDGLSLDKDLFRFGKEGEKIVAVWRDLIESLRSGS